MTCERCASFPWQTEFLKVRNHMLVISLYLLWEHLEHQHLVN